MAMTPFQGFDFNLFGRRSAPATNIDSMFKPFGTHSMRERSLAWYMPMLMSRGLFGDTQNALANQTNPYQFAHLLGPRVEPKPPGMLPTNHPNLLGPQPAQPNLPPLENGRILPDPSQVTFGVPNAAGGSTTSTAAKPPAATPAPATSRPIATEAEKDWLKMQYGYVPQIVGPGHYILENGQPIWDTQYITHAANGGIFQPQGPMTNTLRQQTPAPSPAPTTASAPKPATTVDRSADINQLYQQQLGRAADPAGLQYYNEMLNKGATIQDVVNAMRQSAEWQQRNQHLLAPSAPAPVPAPVAAAPRAPMPVAASVPAPAAPTSAGTNYVADVQQLYQQQLGRAADPAGLQYYVNALQSGATVQDIVRSMQASPENQARYR